MHGGQWGTDDFNTYFDISGIGGHSVFNIYFDISGIGGHGGTVAFNTHLLGSGSGHVQSLQVLNPSTYLRRFNPIQYPTINANTATRIIFSILFINGEKEKKWILIK
jgi:hypothetical protein